MTYVTTNLVEVGKPGLDFDLLQPSLSSASCGALFGTGSHGREEALAESMVVMSKRFIVGGVPEHFNLPWYRAAERHLLQDLGLDYQWRVYPGGTGAMLADLESGELDMAVLLTEGIVAHIANGGDGVIVGTYVDSPLVWGIHVHHSAGFEQAGDLKGKTFAISRLRSGSHIMAYVLADQMGWSPSEDIGFELVGDLEGARIALSQGQADAFMWEKYTTKPLVDAGEWRRVGTCTTPWSPFVMATRRGFAADRAGDIASVVERIATLCGEAVANPEATVKDIATRFGQREEDVRQWLAETHWKCALTADQGELAGVIATLQAVGVLSEPFEASDLVGLGAAPELC
jgi:sulfonate transport system substrate-binding protein